MKTSKAIQNSSDEAEIAALKIELTAAQVELANTITELNEKLQSDPRAFRKEFEDLMTRKFFYMPAFEIYGGVGGLYDYGPPGCAIKDNFLSLWRQHFVLTENMLEISGTCLTPEIVLKTSGHVDKFTDFMVKDVKTGDCHRADKLLEDHIDKLIADPKNPVSAEYKDELLAVRTAADAYSQEELGEILKKYKCVSPDTGNELSDPYPFNLMFQTQIGPTGKFVGYMRPETAQGIFVNFRRLLEYNGGKMPFAAAQIGLAFRNEISPRSGLLRVREFLQAEIEHFVNPDNKDHARFKEIAGVKTNFLSQELQTGEDKSAELTFGEAVATGMINNQTLAYFMCRTALFLIKAGVDPARLRFRQHKADEMAHYAADCWDAEIHTSYGWVECVGHADRAAYDLNVHSKQSKVDLIAQETLDEPKIVKAPTLKIDRGLFGRGLRKQARPATKYLEALDEAALVTLRDQLAAGPVKITLADGSEVEINSKMVSIVDEEKKISSIRYTPSVIEPSFGVGRCMYAILEHSYRVREKAGEVSKYLALAPCIAPIKCGLIPLKSSEDFLGKVDSIARDLTDLNLTSKTDASGASIGRKYARFDEVGIPFTVVVDLESMTDNQVTIRDRDSTQQVRVDIPVAVRLVNELVRGKTDWNTVYLTNTQV